MEVRFQREGLQTTTLCVDSYEGSVLKGRFYNQSNPDGFIFQSVSQLLLGMEQALDRMQTPRPFNSARTFVPSKPAEHKTGPPVSANVGDVATFAVRILFRQNSSWQGSITWLEGRQEQSFRSVLELILLLDNALSYKKVS